MYLFRQNRLIFQKGDPPTDLPPKTNVPPPPVAEKPDLKRAAEEPSKEEARGKRRRLEAAAQEGLLAEPPKIEEGQVDEVRRLAREQAEKLNLQLRTNAKAFYEAMIAHKQLPPEVVAFQKELEENQRELTELTKIKPTTPEELAAYKEKAQKAQAKSAQLRAEAAKIARITQAHEAFLKEAEEIHKLAESEKVSLSELQGGWKWLGLGDELDKDGNIVDEKLYLYEQRFTKLGRAYLDMTVDPETKQEIFLVKQELNATPKIKYGLGAGHLLSPAIQTVAITDLFNVTYYGRRMVVRDGQPVDFSVPGTTGKLGYYTLQPDRSYKYIPIYGGYEIRPVELVEANGTYRPASQEESGKALPAFLDEQSPQYKESVRKEALNYAAQAAIIAQAEKYTLKTPKDVLKYIGRTDYPIAGLKSLRGATPKELEVRLTHYSENQRKAEIERIMSTKQDLSRTEALLDYHRIKLSADNDIEGALQLVGIYNLKEKTGAAQMLGWDAAHTEMQEKWRSELLDKEFIEKTREGDKLTLEYQGKKMTLKITVKDKAYHFSELDSGKEISDIDNWVIEKVAQLLPKKENQTVKLIKAMQNGGSITANQQEFTFSSSEEYNLNFAHLYILNQLANNPTELAKILGTLSKPIKPSEFIGKIMLAAGGKGLSLEQAEKWVRDNNFRILFDDNSNVRLDNLMAQTGDQSKIANQPTRTLAANWNTNQNRKALGDNCCAWFVSNTLGLKTREEGREGLVSRLISRLIRAGRELVFGFENMIAGDVLAWTNYKKHLGRRTYAHVGIVRDTMTFNGQKYLVIQHESSNIQVDIIPAGGNVTISPLASIIAGLKRSKDPTSEIMRLRNEGRLNPQAAAVLANVLDYRAKFKDTINVRPNRGWFGDGSKGANGSIAFAIRTGIASPTGSFEGPAV